MSIDRNSSGVPNSRTRPCPIESLPLASMATSAAKPPDTRAATVSVTPIQADPDCKPPQDEAPERHGQDRQGHADQDAEPQLRFPGCAWELEAEADGGDPYHDHGKHSETPEDRHGRARSAVRKDSPTVGHDVSTCEPARFRMNPKMKHRGTESPKKNGMAHSVISVPLCLPITTTNLILIRFSRPPVISGE